MIARSHLTIISLGAALASAGLVRGPAPAVPHHAPYLRIAAQPSRVVSGYPITLRVTVTNPTALPLCLDEVAPIEVFAAGPRSRGPGGAIRMSRYGNSMIDRLTSATANSGVVTLLVGPRRSLGLKAGFPLGRAYDLTMPGRYTVRLVTQRPVYLVSRKTDVFTHRSAVTIGRHLFLPPYDEWTPKGSVAKSAAESGKCVVTVAAPYGKLSPVALKPVSVVLPQGRRFSAARLWAKPIAIVRSGRPVLLRIWLYAGSKPLRLRLTGNPLVDFSPTQVDGPDGRAGYGLIKKPRPHYGPFPNWRAVPLTAYGRWLVKHNPPGRLRAKAYLLKPGIVYEYTVPLNLSCRFDMTLAGYYHIRLRLAHGNLDSGWIDVRRHGYPNWKNIPIPTKP